MSATSTAVTSYARNAARLAFAAAAFAFGMALLGGRAHAADAPPASAPTDAAAPAPSTDGLWVPAATATAPATDPVPTPTPTPTPAPATDPAPAPPVDAATPPAPAASADPGTPTTTGTAAAAPPAPTDVSNQGAGVTSTGTGVANSGGNTAVGNTNGAAATPCPTDGGAAAALLCVTNPTSNATVGSGAAQAQGTASGAGIAQLTNIQTHQNGQVDVLQVALVINIGVGIADSGNNAAGAAGGPSLGIAGVAGIGTGSADVMGLLGNTSVIQSATLVGGTSNGQTVTVLNVGFGVGNTGLNFATGSVAGGANQAVAAAGPPGSGGAGIIAGAAHAVGDQSGSMIMQVVSVTASNDGRITVTQRAVIINFGLALANSGANTAASALASLPDAQRTLVESLIAALFGLDPAAIFGGGQAGIWSGNATAIGNNSQSSVVQRVDGAVSGTDQASSDQSAWIGNFGAALANTGANGAVGSLALLPDGSPMGTAEQQVARFLGLLFHPAALAGSNAQLASALDLGSALIDLKGNIAGTELLAGLDEHGAFTTNGGGIRVRQINGVLNIAIALANSGDNTAISSVTGANPQALAGAEMSQIVGRAAIITGKVNVLGERATVVVCQVKGDDATICAPPVVAPPTTPPTAPPIIPVAVESKTQLEAPRPTAAATVGAGSLPFTGAPLTLEALLGLALTGGGVLLQRRTRRGRETTQSATDATD